MAALPDKHRLLRNINRCIDQEEKYLYLIELGEKLPPAPETLYQSKNLVSGCQSQVWIDLCLQSDSTIVLEGDSDTALVKGLIAIVIILYHGLDAKGIIDFAIYDWFEQLALMRHLTSSRTQGLEAMIKTIRARALCITQ